MNGNTKKLSRLAFLGTQVALIAGIFLRGASGCEVELSSSAGQSSQVVSPSSGKVTQLFNGQDLSGFDHWLQGVGEEDPNRAFSVVDGMIRISGEGIGYLATVDNFRDYHLSLEYRWGMNTDGSGSVRNSGILLHATGAHGNYKGRWMASIECQLAQGCEGDLIVMQGQDLAGNTIPVFIASDTTLASDGRTRWNRGGTKTDYSGRQFWWSRHQVDFEERLDNRGENDVANPVGEWTRVECLCIGDRITIKINGVTVNECYEVSPSSGKILLENEGSEVFFRNLELYSVSVPIKKTNTDNR
ncbi:3-keto-disaccharide hydrolase [Bythopirellula goksoeyrii]|uniref:3-keto-alpha-glucoside-1,2-lyase/3-keto-2-hydroxy-glucal hydratase domain-containing protein n=1 Tax=Bythopirellula goksoeyrii TaxID=1400387 RepID=A0A5B9QEH2_9BACT|nr:DUF1080 domain-containing protein [Bythopirellula goksoeyrii]QEG36279.1 hypothetical protein Pr1d_35910 [Bythopirellula goksoeyrii]